jgi:hypothetical protein
MISHLVGTTELVLLNNTIIIEYDLDLKRQKISPTDCNHCLNCHFEHPPDQMVLHPPYQMDLHTKWVLKINIELFY